jgi:predicted RND superfamily exporter protein
MFISLLLVAAATMGTSRLQVASGVDIFFADDDPHLIAEKQLKSTYGREDNILLVIEAQSSDLFTPENLSLLHDLTQKAWLVPSAKRVDSISNYLHPEVAGDDIDIRALIADTAELSPTRIEKIKQISLSEPALVGRLISPDGAVAAININLLLPEQDTPAAIAAAVNSARALAEDAMATMPGLTIHLTGWAVTEQTLAEVTAKDAATLMPVLFMLVLAALALILRSALAAVCTVVVIALSVGVGMGFAGWAGISLNSVNVSAPTIILTLAVADCIHLLTVFLKNFTAESSKKEALHTALQSTLYPIFLTSVTTAIGFLSMLSSESPPFGELGIISAVGVLGALWVTVTILPGLVLLLPFKPLRQKTPGVPMKWLAEFVITHYNRLFWLFLIGIAVAISGVARIEINDDPSAYFSDKIPLSRALEVVDNHLSGTQSLHYSLNAGAADSVPEPEFLRAVDEFAIWLRLQPEVVNVEVFTETLKRLNQVMHGDDAHWRKLPDSRELAAQYTLLYEISVPYGQDATHLVSADKSHLKVGITLRNQKSQGLIAFEARCHDWLLQHWPEFASRGVGQSISFAHVGLRNIQSMLFGSLLAILFVSACLVLAFRSLRFGLVSLIPNLFPAFVTLGIWGLIVQEVNIAASVVFSLTLGIIVDDTTHFLVKYTHARSTLKLSVEDAIRWTFAAVGSALVTTSIVLAIGFLALVQSDFSVNSTSGLLVAATILAAIVLDLMFLPTVLIKADALLVRQEKANTGHSD